jgi:5-(carboxyamino)imidazole ribonucleotide synthase
MMAPAAVPLGIHLRVLAETPHDPAAQVLADVSLGDYRDLETLQRFAAGCDVVTFDHEHVPPEHLRRLEDDGVALRPGPGALLYAQDKVAMRDRLSASGVPCPRYRVVSSVEDVVAFAGEVGWPVMLKAPRGGYDGKGVWTATDVVEVAATLAQAGGTPLLAEERVEFTQELAVLVARSPLGQAVAYPVVRTVQRDGICREVIAPAPGLSEEHAVQAEQAALQVAHDLGVTGVMAVELFDTPGGVLVNELAMRPHNSGHWTIDGAVTDQFEQHLRAVLDLPLGVPYARAPYTVMINVLGGPRTDLHSAFVHTLARDTSVRLHVYGKAVKPGRKVGHVTVYGADLDDLLARGRDAASYVGGEPVV